MSGRQPKDVNRRAMQGLVNSMPPPFRAFHTQYHQPYFEYARIQLGDWDAADELVHGTFLYLAFNWQHFTRQGSFEADAWALHKERVATELTVTGRPPAGPETLAFARAIRAATDAVMGTFREHFRAQVDELEHSIGLYRAMTHLPERQFDVVLLRYALGYTTKHTASVMGITPATVRTLRCSAKRRLAAELDLDMEVDIDDEE
ncbi:RNA polymerase sigma factor [Streptomyces sp. NPDC054841]